MTIRPLPTLWTVSLVSAGAVFSLAFACAAPLAAFAALAALTSARREALALTASIWLANQLVGFAFLHYPMEFETFAWGGALGAIALVCCETSGLVARRTAGDAAPVVAFVASFLVYEAALFAITRAVGGDVSHYAPASVARIFAINASAFFGLAAARLLGAWIGAATLSTRRA